MEDFAVNPIEFRHVLAKGEKVGGLVDHPPSAAALLREGLHPFQSRVKAAHQTHAHAGGTALAVPLRPIA